MEFRRRFLIEFGIYALVVVVLSLGLFFLARHITEQMEGIIQTRGQIHFWSESTQILANLKQDAHQATLYKTALATALPKKDQLINFVPDIRILAAANKVTVTTSLGAQAPAPDNKLTTTSFSLSAAGQFDDILLFLAGLKKTKYPVKFNSIDIIRKDGQKAGFVMTMRGAIYSL